MISNIEIRSDMATKSGLSSNFLRVRAVLVLAAAGTVLAACGSSSKGASTGAPAGTVSTAPSTSSSSSKSSGSTGSTNLGGGSFCDKARKAQTDVASAATKLTQTPDQLKAFEENAQAELSKLADEAPSEIKGAVSTIADTENKLLDTLKAANFDFKKIDTSSLSSFDTPQFTQAVQQVDTYLVTKCGLSPSDFPTDSPS
jgi:hypothetical protein